VGRLLRGLDQENECYERVANGLSLLVDVVVN
jgi:hypothetical protein